MDVPVAPRSRIHPMMEKTIAWMLPRHCYLEWHWALTWNHWLWIWASICMNHHESLWIIFANATSNKGLVWARFLANWLPIDPVTESILHGTHDKRWMEPWRNTNEHDWSWNESHQHEHTITEEHDMEIVGGFFFILPTGLLCRRRWR